MGIKTRSEEYARYKICEKFGWDYWTYEQQPQHFLEEINLFMMQEHEAEKAQNDQLKVQSARAKSSGGIKRY